MKKKIISSLFFSLFNIFFYYSFNFLEIFWQSPHPTISIPLIAHLSSSLTCSELTDLHKKVKSTLTSNNNAINSSRVSYFGGSFFSYFTLFSVIFLQLRILVILQSIKRYLFKQKIFDKFVKSYIQ